MGHGGPGTAAEEVVNAPVKRGRPRRVSDEVIVEMLGMADSVRAAARALGYSDNALQVRAQRSAAVAQALAAAKDWRKAYGIPAMPRKPTARLSVAEVVRGLDAAPSAQEGAAALGYTKQALYLRAKDSPEIRDALHRAALRGTARDLTDEAIRAALNAAPSLGEAAEALGVGEAALSLQVNRRGLVAELDAMKARQRAAKTLYSDDAIVEAFRQHGTVKRSAAALGTSCGTLYFRLRDPDLAARVAPYRRDGRAR